MLNEGTGRNCEQQWSQGVPEARSPEVTQVDTALGFDPKATLRSDIEWQPSRFGLEIMLRQLRWIPPVMTFPTQPIVSVR